jgi:hypothetical protein
MVGKRPAEPSRATIFNVCGTLLIAVALGGCVTKSKANAQARAAFLAGQQEAMARMQQPQTQTQTQGREPSVTLNGEVRNRVVPWTAGLTLAKALLAADYYGTTDPDQIMIVHNGMATRVDPKMLLTGVDIPLQPGDVVRITPQSAAPKQ